MIRSHSPAGRARAAARGAAFVVLACGAGCGPSEPPPPACGDGTADPGESCDGVDLAGADCSTAGAFAGGTLGCAADCTFDTSACTAPPAGPTVPFLRRPMNGAAVGSVHVPGSLRPAFAWEASSDPGGAALTYDLEYGTDPTFGSGVVAATTAALSDQPGTDLAVATAPPVGARYYWRVRACSPAACSDYSAPWRVDVGRDRHDLNGDGYADVAVGAPTDGGGAGGAPGAVTVYFGGAGATVDATPDGTLAGEAGGDQFGWSVAAAGDVNADGFADLLVGAPTNDTAGTDAGAAYVYLGGAGDALDPVPDATLRGAAAGGLFGRSVAAAGDVDADGFDDLVVGAYLDDGAGVGFGAAYVFRGGAGAFEPTPAGALFGTAAGTNFGVAVSGAGDVDGDGAADVAVGAPFDAGAAPGAGAVHVYLGGSGAFDPTPDATLAGEAAGDNFGIALAAAGDVNGDGFGDLVVGAPDNDFDSANAGRAYVYLGGAGGPDAAPAGAPTAFSTQVYFGLSVAGAGDVNGDGYDDVVVGAPQGGTGNQGRMFVYLGGPGAVFDESSDGADVGESANDYFATGVSGAGDVNGDGLADVVAGAPNSSAAAASAGRAYVYLGGAGDAFEGTADAVLDGADADGWAGAAVADAAAARAPVPTAALVRRRRRPLRR